MADGKLDFALSRLRIDLALSRLRTGCSTALLRSVRALEQEIRRLREENEQQEYELEHLREVLNHPKRGLEQDSGEFAVRDVADAATKVSRPYDLDVYED